MKRIFIAALLVALSTPAFAGGTKVKATGGVGYGTGGNAQGGAGGKGGTGGTAISSGGDAKGGTATANGSVTVNNSTYAKRSAFAPDLAGLTNGPCTGASATFGVGVPGFAGGMGASSLDKDCTLRYNIGVVAQFDQKVAAEMINDLTGVKEAKERLAAPAMPGTRFGVVASASRPYWCQDRINAGTLSETTGSESDRRACGLK